MQTDPNRVDWALWLRTRERDLRDPHKMVPGEHCVLCERRLDSWKRAEHHRAHMLELDAYLAEQETAAGPKPDSLRRSRSRLAKRMRGKRLAQEFNKDPFLFTVVRVKKVAPNNPNDRRVQPVVKRRLRRPRGETLDRIREALALGRAPAAIADELHLSENYVRRLTRRIEGVGGLK